MANITAHDQTTARWASWPCDVIAPPRGIIIHDEDIAGFTLGFGDTCALDKDRAPVKPQRSMLAPQGVRFGKGVPIEASFWVQVCEGPINDAPWCVLHQLMPTPDQDPTTKAWIEPFPSPELALEILTEGGVEFLRFVTRAYPDRLNKTITKPGEERCRWPLKRTGRGTSRIRYRYVSATDGQPNGALRVEANGKVLCDLTGIACGSNDARGPYPSFGCYREGRAKAPITVTIGSVAFSAA